MKNVKDYVVTWFVMNSLCEIDEVNENLDSNYFELGWIDSMQFISFVSDLETTFTISFDNSEFQNRAFATINGLCSIILNKVGD